MTIRRHIGSRERIRAELDAARKLREARGIKGWERGSNTHINPQVEENRACGHRNPPKPGLDYYDNQ